MTGAGSDTTNIDAIVRGVPLPLRWLVGGGGAALLVVGAVAVFATPNGTGAAALVAAGAALVVVAFLVERLQSVEAAGMKFVLGAQAAARTKEQEALVAEAGGNHEKAERLRREAAEIRDAAAVTGRMYEHLRSNMDSSWQRTQKIEELFGELTRSTPSALDSDVVSEIFNEGSDGSRVVALKLMQHDPRTANVDAICAAISDSRSAMEQWQALSAAERAVGYGVSEGQRAKLRRVIEAALAGGKIRQEDTDRHAVSERLLKRL